VALLELQSLFKRFEKRSGHSAATDQWAVNNVTLSVAAGETLGIVGESGSGKSTLLRMVLRLTKPSSGTILFKGRDVWTASRAELFAMRREIQAIFQDPASSFNPRQRIGEILDAPLAVHGQGDRDDRRARVKETMSLIGLPEDFIGRYPHQLSGGQRQRVAIARAIILKPSVVLADEPTSALDVSIQAQILNLLQETKRRLGLTMIFVSHNLAVVRHVSDRVAVMRKGEVLEIADCETLFSNPQHDYTKALISASPDPRTTRVRSTAITQGGRDART
jgi:ABC-type glutathione transport system ATPase component